MADDNLGTSSSYNLKHFRVEDFRSEEVYSPPNRDMSGVSSGRNRAVHGPKLQQDLAKAFERAHSLITARDPGSAGDGVYLELESAADKKLPDLNYTSKDIRLGALRINEAGAEVGTLYVPAAAEQFLATKVTEYATQNTPKQLPKHEDKFAPVETINAGTLRSLWTDQRSFPEDASQRLWWECWCWRDRAESLARVAGRFNLRVSERRLLFPELEVIPVYANSLEMDQLLQNSNAIEELRYASDTPVFFTTTARREQSVWIADLVGRITPPPVTSPAICILDSGIVRAHPLLTGALAVDDCFTTDSAWGVDDHEPGGHGTNMAGTTLYGDLTYPLADQRLITLEIKLESVKFLPPAGFVPTHPNNYGSITQAAVALPEIKYPARPRVFCMAVTNGDVSGERPTSWSAALDQICAGVMAGDEPDAKGEPPRRLFFVSAGNIPDASDPDEIADPDEFPIEDPAQAWNAIAVGGFTDKIDIKNEDGLPGWRLSPRWAIVAPTVVYLRTGIIPVHR